MTALERTMITFRVFVFIHLSSGSAKSVRAEVWNNVPSNISKTYDFHLSFFKRK